MRTCNATSTCRKRAHHLRSVRSQKNWFRSIICWFMTIFKQIKLKCAIDHRLLVVFRVCFRMHMRLRVPKAIICVRTLWMCRKIVKLARVCRIWYKTSKKWCKTSRKALKTTQNPVFQRVLRTATQNRIFMLLIFWIPEMKTHKLDQIAPLPPVLQLILGPFLLQNGLKAPSLARQTLPF